MHTALEWHYRVEDKSGEEVLDEMLWTGDQRTVAPTIQLTVARLAHARGCRPGETFVAFVTDVRRWSWTSEEPPMTTAPVVQQQQSIFDHYTVTAPNSWGKEYRFRVPREVADRVEAAREDGAEILISKNQHFGREDGSTRYYKRRVELYRHEREREIAGSQFYIIYACYGKRTFAPRRRPSVPPPAPGATVPPPDPSEVLLLSPSAALAILTHFHIVAPDAGHSLNLTPTLVLHRADQMQLALYLRGRSPEWANNQIVSRNG
jgi:hypothetical protein